MWAMEWSMWCDSISLFGCVCAVKALCVGRSRTGGLFFEGLGYCSTADVVVAFVLIVSSWSRLRHSHIEAFHSALSQHECTSIFSLFFFCNFLPLWFCCCCLLVRKKNSIFFCSRSIDRPNVMFAERLRIAAWACWGRSIVVQYVLMIFLWCNWYRRVAFKCDLTLICVLRLLFLGCFCLSSVWKRSHRGDQANG